MKRLTTDNPDGNFETLLNLVFSRDGWAHIRTDSEERAVPLTQWAKGQCILHGCGEFSAETPEEIDEEISDCLMMDFPDCPIALAYGFASQACHLRDRLKMYEDIFFADDGTERLTLDELQELANICPSKRFTPGDTVYVIERDEDGNACEPFGYMFLAVADNFAICSAFINDLTELDETMACLSDDTVENDETGLAIFPLPDVFRHQDDARRCFEEGLS